VDEIKQILFDDVTARQMLLDAREREILENHLVGNVSRTFANCFMQLRNKCGK